MILDESDDREGCAHCTTETATRTKRSTVVEPMRTSEASRLVAIAHSATKLLEFLSNVFDKEPSGLWTLYSSRRGSSA